MSDFVLSDHGTLAILVPLSEEAHDWVDDNLGDDALWYGRGIAIEARYVGAILEGITSDGLTVEE